MGRKHGGLRPPDLTAAAILGILAALLASGGVQFDSGSGPPPTNPPISAPTPVPFPTPPPFDGANETNYTSTEVQGGSLVVLRPSPRPTGSPSSKRGAPAPDNREDEKRRASAPFSVEEGNSTGDGPTSTDEGIPLVADKGSDDDVLDGFRFVAENRHLQCDNKKCGKVVAFKETWFALEGCKHIFCPSCFARIGSRRGGDLWGYDCPCCRGESLGYHDCELQEERRGRRTRVVGKAIRLPMPSIETSPFHHFNEMDKTVRDDHMSIHMVYSSKQGQVTTVASLLPLIESIEMDDPQKEVVEAIAMKLHTPLMYNDKKEIACFPKPHFLCPSAIEDRIGLDNSLLRRVMHGIGSGETLETGNKRYANSNREQDLCKNRVGWTAADLVRTASKPNEPGMMASVTGEYLKNMGAGNKLIQYFKRHALSSCKEAIRLKEVDDVNAKITRGWDMKKKAWDLLLVVYDNIGFKVRGASTGYDQYTVLKVITIPYDKLKAKGITALSRARRAWGEIRNSVNVDEFLISKKDIELYSKRHMNTLHTILESYNDFPTLSEARDLVQKWQVATVKNRVLWNRADVAMEFAKRPEPIEGEEERQTLTSTTVGDDDVNAEDTQTVEYVPEGTNDLVQNEIPLHADLNSVDTVEHLMEYSLALKNAALAGAKSNELRDGLRPIMESTGVFMAGDGSPSFAFHRIYDESVLENDQSKYDGVHNHAGGLHNMLQLLKCIGRMFRKTHLEDLIQSWRDTPGKQEWVLTPSDPTQALREKYESFAGIISDLIETVAEKNALAKSMPSGSKVDVSPSDLHKHMLERAGEEPLALIVLMQLRFDEIVFMLVDSEKTGEAGSDPDLYRSGMSIAALLFSVTGSFKYVQIVMEFKVWWQCASEADRKIWEQFIHTKQVKSGKRTFMDRFVEWGMRDIREYLGKYAHRNMEQLMTRTMLTLDEKKNLKMDVKLGEGSYSATTDKVALSAVYCFSRIWSREINLWGNGPALVGKPGKRKPREDGALVSSDVNGLTEDVIDLIDAAQERLESYANEYYFEGDLHQTVRPHRTVDLRFVPPLQSDKEAFEKEYKIWSRSISANEIAKKTRVGKDDIIANTRDINRKLPRKDRIEEIPRGKNREKLAEVLVAARKKYMKKNKSTAKAPAEWNFISDEIKKKSARHSTGRTGRGLNNFFFQLEKGVIREYRSAEKRVQIKYIGREFGEEEGETGEEANVENSQHSYGDSQETTLSSQDPFLSQSQSQSQS